jgi:ubiquinone/menaquinone biosynthesis C-methylase UbiE
MTSSASGVNHVARTGFEKAAPVYDAYRPGYAEAVVSFIRNLHPTTIVDVGAGTGKLTRLLLLTGATRIIAVEPVEKMSHQLPTTVTILNDSASHMNIPDNTADVVTCGQSFHWFATQEALKEIHRILKPDGILVLVWNTTDAAKKQAWHDEFTELVDR